MHSIISIFIMFLYMYLTTFENFEFRKFGKVIFIFNKINFLINNIIIYSYAWDRSNRNEAYLGIYVSFYRPVPT